MKMLKMIRKNRKKLDNKGFTLIELLAVIVILAIVMGISASSVLTSINNSRKSSLYSAAQTAANQLNQWVTEDAVVTDEGQKMLGDAFVNGTQGGTNPDKWFCLNSGAVESIRNRDNKDTDASVSLLKALGINTADIVTAGTAPTADTAPDETSVCSAVKYNSSTGGYEILLIANKGGKYYVTTDSEHYAFSRATGYNKPIND